LYPGIDLAMALGDFGPMHLLTRRFGWPAAARYGRPDRGTGKKQLTQINYFSDML
jgi:hypothetical protein